MGTDDKDKKAAMKGIDDLRGDMESLRALHDQLGKHLDAWDKNIDTLQKAMQDDNERAQKERWKIQQQLQDKIFDTVQDVTKNKQKTADKAFKAVDGYIRG